MPTTWFRGAPRAVLPALRGVALRTTLCAALAATLPLPAAHAQPRPDPTDPRAAVPESRPRSALDGPRRPGDPPPLSWREANERVARIGGWRSYLREAQAPEPTPAPAASGVPR